VADIFVSYTSQDRAWAEWIGQELKKLGHVVNIQDWAVAADGIQERQKIASHVLCVISEAHLKSPYFNPEEKIARWAASSQRSNFLLLAFIEPCEVPLANYAPATILSVSQANQPARHGRQYPRPENSAGRRGFLYQSGRSGLRHGSQNLRRP
jgi:hypothetical protein